MSSRQWQVWIADLRASKKIAAERRELASRQLSDAIEQTVRAHRRSFKLRPSVLRGDEIQAVLLPDAPALTILTYLRAQLATRARPIQALYAGLGHGEISKLHPRNPFESDGPAFHRARQALDSLKSRKHGRTLTAWITSIPSFDEGATAMLPLLDGYFSRWSREQWQAVAHQLRGATMRSIGEVLGVTAQAVNKRLVIARWNEVFKAILYLESRQPGRVGRRR